MAVRLPQGVTITYQLQRRRCGKTSCHTCQTGPGHGPYWYGYWRGSDGKQHATYIGKVLPLDVSLSLRQGRPRRECSRPEDISNEMR
jgi:hypothetical protein